MRLNELRDNDGARKARMRLGRGKGSGKGKTGSRGQNGQKSRSGVSLVGFEGGQMPLYRRLPKRGFNNIFTKEFEIVNTGRLQKAINEKKLDVAKAIDVQAMTSAGLVSGNKDGVRLLGMGEVTAKLIIEVAGASKSAVATVEAAGGKIIFSGPTKTLQDAREKSVKSRVKKGDREALNDKDKLDAGADDEAISSEE